MSFGSLLRHTFIIERPTDGAVDDHNQPITTYAALATVPGIMQPKAVKELAALNQAGATVSTHTAYLRPTEIQPSDRIRIAAGAMAGTYEIDGIRNAAGMNRHLEADCRQVVT